MCEVLSFPNPTLTYAEAARLAETNDLDKLYEAFVYAARTCPITFAVLQQAAHFGWNRQMTVMMATHALLMQNHSLQEQVLGLLRQQPVQIPQN